MMPACKHPQVRVVAREEEIEYVECLLCGEVFDSQEFKDMEKDAEMEIEALSTVETTPDVETHQRPFTSMRVFPPDGPGASRSAKGNGTRR